MIKNMLFSKKSSSISIFLNKASGFDCHQYWNGTSIMNTFLREYLSLWSKSTNKVTIGRSTEVLDDTWSVRRTFLTPSESSCEDTIIYPPFICNSHCSKETNTPQVAQGAWQRASEKGMQTANYCNQLGALQSPHWKKMGPLQRYRCGAEGVLSEGMTATWPLSTF
jgi:hypothetical protein